MHNLKVGDRVVYHHTEDVFTVTKVHGNFIFLKEVKGRYNAKNLRKATFYEKLRHMFSNLIS